MSTTAKSQKIIWGILLCLLIAAAFLRSSPNAAFTGNQASVTDIGHILPNAQASKSAPCQFSLYSDGDIVRSSVVEDVKYWGPGVLFLIPLGGNKTDMFYANGTWVVEPKSNLQSNKGPSSQKATHTISLYSGGNIVKTWDVIDFTASRGANLQFIPVDGKTCTLHGTYTIDPIK